MFKIYFSRVYIILCEYGHILFCMKKYMIYTDIPMLYVIFSNWLKLWILIYIIFSGVYKTNAFENILERINLLRNSLKKPAKL